jgi:uncharacterized protein
MTSSIFPDVNVWLALSYRGHAHHGVAQEWFASLDGATVFTFCRQTQLGFFRVMTSKAVMGKDVRTQRECWAIYDRWVDAGKAIFTAEPSHLSEVLRSRCTASSAASQAWINAYMTAFAEAARLTLATFNASLASEAKAAILLG